MWPGVSARAAHFDATTSILSARVPSTSGLQLLFTSPVNFAPLAACLL